MARKKRGSAAAARAAKARATKEAIQQKKTKEDTPEVPEDDPSTSSSVTEQEDKPTVETTEEVQPPSPKDMEVEADEISQEDKNEESSPTSDSNEQSEEASPVPKSTLPQDETPGTSADKTADDASDMPQRPDSQDKEDQSFHLDAMLTDKSYLIDIKLGYSDEKNLKTPLKCFTTDDELQLFPVIESMSAKLYTIVQKMNAFQKSNVETAIKLRKGVLKLPSLHYKSFLCQMNVLNKHAEAEKSAPTKRAPHPFLLTEDENMFTEDKLKMLRAVLDSGWKREVVMRSPGSTGRKTGDVYYYSPDGTKFRSSKQVEKHLADLGDTPFTIENFTFAKVRISTNPEQEIVRKAYDGKSPPRAPPKPPPSKAKPASHSKGESSKSVPKPSTSTAKETTDIPETRTVEEPPVKGVSSRRSIQPPKRYSGDAVLLLSKRSKVQDDKHRNSNSNKGLMQMGMLPPKYPKGVEDSSNNISESMDFGELGGSSEDLSGSNSVAMKEIAEDSLFQISALRQSGGIDVDNMHQLVESQKQLAQKAAQAALNQEEQGNVAGSSKRGGGTVIPCSIRCPGMDGQVPNLQCVRCLCLFHAECLGLPPNLAFNKYLCTNCTTEQKNTSSVATNPSNSHKTRVSAGVAPKRSPPGLAPIPHGGILRGPGTTREVTVTLTAKETHTRLPHKAVPSSVGVARGMIRSRGMPPPQGRSPSAQVHPGHRMMAPESSIQKMGGHPQIVKRGRGRPPSVPQNRPMPQLAKNLTITSLPRIPGAPPVPNLQPMGAPKAMSGKIGLPLMGGSKPRQAIPSVPNLMKSNAFRLTVPPPSLSGRTFKKVIPQSHTQTPTNLRLNPGTTVVSKPAPVVQSTTQERTISIVKRYPQTVCTIGKKKFVVLPKRKQADFPPATVTTAVGNGGLPKGHPFDVLRHPDITVKKTGPPQDQVNCTGNDILRNESTTDGPNEVDNADATPMDHKEEDGLDTAGANELIAAKE